MKRSLQLLGKLQYFLAGSIDMRTLIARTARGLLDLARAFRDRGNEMRGVDGIDGEAIGGGDLLLGRTRDRPEERADGVDRFGDLVHTLDQRGGVRLQRRDLALDVLGRSLGLHRKRFHFRRDHRKAAAGIARPRRLDGGVECQKVGLLRNRRDQVDDSADIGRGRLQAVDPRGRG